MTRLPLPRRSVLKGAAALAAAAGLPRAATAQSGSLSLWTPGGSDLFCQIHTGLVTRFAEAQGLTPEVQCGIGQSNEYTQVLIGAIAGGQPPDISMLWDSPISLGIQGAFMPLDEMMAGSRIPAETWPGGLLSSVQFRGVTYGLPVTAGIYTYWYNEEMFEAKGIPSDRASFPKTWDEMRAMSKEFTRWEGDFLAEAGFMPPRVPEQMPIWSALNGTTLFDGEKYTIDDERNVEMMSYFLDWLEEEYRGDVNLIDRSGAFNDGYPSASSGLGPAFREGRLAGLQSGSWLMGDIYADPVPTFERWNLAPQPFGPSGTTTRSGSWPNWFVIPTGSRNPEAAFAYLEELSINGVREWYAVIPDVPTNSQVELTPPTALADRRGEAFAADVTAFLQEQAQVVAPMWNSPVEAFGIDQMRIAMEKIYTKVAPVREALAEAQAASQAELNRVLGG